MNYEQELYNAISLLDLFDKDLVHVGESGVVFQVTNISGKENFSAVGRASIDVQEEERPVEFMDFSLVLAKNIGMDKVTEINEKLYELNILFKSGVFSIEADGSLVYESYFPVIRDDVETSLKLFIAEYANIKDFLDGLYPYILRIIVKPEDSDLTEYIKAAFALAEQ